MKNLKYLFVFTLALLLTSCSSDDNIQEEVDIINNQPVINFLNNMVDIMAENSINKNTIDWVDFRQQVLERGAEAQTLNQTSSAMFLALDLLGDNHSSIFRPSGGTINAIDVNCNPQDLAPVTTPNNIGYVKIEGFSGGGDAARNFANQIQDAIRNQDNADIIGWIVDLRNNTGGNMWPMIAGVGPILGNGLIGHFVDPDDNITTWSYNDGSSFINQNPLVTVSNPYQLINPNPKVAILTNNAVISSGEATFIAFIGRANTQSFGAVSCGLSTANAGFDLGQGYRLNLTVSTMADRNLNLYGARVTPDNIVDDQDVVQSAIDYLNN